MLSLNYNDFDELYYNFNKSIIENPNDYVEDLDLCSAFLPFTVIELNENKCNLDLGELYYTKIKFKRLVSTYMDLDKFFVYKSQLKDCKGTSLTYYFNQVKKSIGNNKNNGPCIISFVLTRKNRSSDWNEMNIYYRTCELGRRFGVDLILFHVILKELNINVNKIRLIISKPYFSTMTACGLIKKLNINMDLFEDNDVHNSIKRQFEIMNKKDKISNYSSRKKIQKIVLGMSEIKPININELRLSEGDLFDYEYFGN